MSIYYVECAENKPLSKPTFNDILIYTLRDIAFNCNYCSLGEIAMMYIDLIRANKHSLENIKRFLKKIKKCDMQGYTPDQFDPDELYIPLDDWFENLQLLINAL